MLYVNTISIKLGKVEEKKKEKHYLAVFFYFCTNRRLIEFLPSFSFLPNFPFWLEVDPESQNQICMMWLLETNNMNHFNNLNVFSLCQLSPFSHTKDPEDFQYVFTYLFS